jgi:AcrR family transcriptional regulator
MTKAYGKPTTALERAQRQKQALDLLAQGGTTTEIARTLNISRTTLWRYFQDIEAKFDMELPADFKKAKLAQLARLREFICSGRISDGRIAELLLQVHDREVKLGPELKLNTGHQPSTVVNETSVTITAEAVEAYKRLKAEERAKLLTAGGGQ